LIALSRVLALRLSSTISSLVTLPLHDALPISLGFGLGVAGFLLAVDLAVPPVIASAILLVKASIFLLIAWKSARLVMKPNSTRRDRKSTRLNSSHVSRSYAVFCLKKKNQHNME